VLYCAGLSEHSTHDTLCLFVIHCDCALQLLLVVRGLRDGLAAPLQRVPCAVAVSLARAVDVLATSPAHEAYPAINRY
jgi:hypothetical protein